MIRWEHCKGYFQAMNRLEAHELQQLGLEQATGSSGE